MIQRVIVMYKYVMQFVRTVSIVVVGLGSSTVFKTTNLFIKIAVPSDIRGFITDFERLLKILKTTQACYWNQMN